MRPVVTLMTPSDTLMSPESVSNRSRAVVTHEDARKVCVPRESRDLCTVAA
jgi:hypothetical protein